MVLLKVPMEADQEVIKGSDDKDKEVSHDNSAIIKGKRTKRPRPASPLTLAMTTSSSSSSMVSPSSASLEIADRNEEDMANCLILLAQGHHHHHQQQQQQNVIPKLSEPPLPQTSSKFSTGESCVYQCKTCNRCFPSFQALGGHRASHKKPKLNNNSEDNNKKAAVTLLDQEVEDHHQRRHHHQYLDNNMSTTLSLQIVDKGIFCSNTVKSNNKVHECSICSAEFSSGQALGGHMRRHRAVVATTSSTTPTPTTATSVMSLGTSSSPDHLSQESKKSGNSLQLDLNLPAPDEEDDCVQEQHSFHFASPKEQFLVFSASSLVDCNY